MAMQIEQYLPGIAQNGLNTKKSVNFSGFVVDTSGNATVPGTLAVTGAFTQTGSQTLNGGATIGDGQNIVLGTTTGTKIGTATTQKLGFFNATPVVQPSSTGNSAVTTAVGSTTTIFVNTTFTGGVGTTAYAVADIIANLKNLGILAS